MEFRYTGVGNVIASTVSLLFFATMLWSGSACPPRCECQDRDGNVDATCTDFQQIDHGTLPTNLSKLTLEDLKSTMSPCTSSLSSVTEVEIRNSNLESKPLGWVFSCYQNISALRVVYNSMPVVKYNTFLNREPPVALRELSLRSNFIVHVEPGTFRFFKDLKEIALSHNKIRYISPDTFPGLSKLSLLYLDNNPLNITTIDKDLFKEVPQVQVLYITVLGLNYVSKSRLSYLEALSNLTSLSIGSNIEQIHRDSFCGHSFLREISLMNNNLNNMSLEFINCLPNLKFLHIVSSRLTGILFEKTSRKDSIENVSLTDNALNSFPVKIFSIFPSLKSIDLSRNPMLVLRQNDLNHYTCSLTHISFFLCGINFIPFDYFMNCQTLKYIDARQNKIMFIPHLPSENILALFGENPIYCGCKLDAIKQFTFKQPVRAAGITYLCAAPAIMVKEGPGDNFERTEDRKRQFTDKFSALPLCKEPAVAEFSLKQSEDSRIECKAQGDPVPVITIIRPDGETVMKIPERSTARSNSLIMLVTQPGSYKCKAFNIEGEDSAMVQISNVTGTTGGTNGTVPPQLPATNNNILLYTLPPIFVGVVAVAFIVIVVLIIHRYRKLSRRPKSEGKTEHADLGIYSKPDHNNDAATREDHAYQELRAPVGAPVPSNN